MLRQSLLIVTVLFAFSASAYTDKQPFDEFFNTEIERLELELELFGTPATEDIASVASIAIYEVEEDIILNFDTAVFLPKCFNAKAGMSELNWNNIELIEVEEEVELGFNTKDHLPLGFNPYKGMMNNKTQVSNSL